MTAACTSATSRTSTACEPPLGHIGYWPRRMFRTRPVWSPRCGSCGPSTPPGCTITTGAPSAWSSRATASEATFDRAYAPRDADSAESGVLVAPRCSSATELETCTTGSQPCATAARSTFAAPAALVRLIARWERESRS